MRSTADMEGAAILQKVPVAVGQRNLKTTLPTIGDGG
jgi:hypothetical protein